MALTKNQHLYGDDWEDSEPEIDAKLPSTTFVQADVLTPEAPAQVSIKFAPVKPKQAPKPVLKPDSKTQELESKLTQKYGKALKML
jgi:hypothetical protein